MLLGFVTASLGGGTAWAQDEAEASERQPNPEDARSPEDTDFGHGGQFGIRVGAVWGYRMIFRYPDSPFCVEPDPTEDIDNQQKFCGHVGPWSLDAALSFAVLDSIEPYVWGRFGLEGEAQTNTQEVLFLGAGARIYTMSDSALKIFVEPAIGFGFEGGAGNELYNPPNNENYDPEYKTDFIFHVAAGPHWDFARHFGAYLSAGLTVGTLRYISASMELTLGVQARFP